MTGQHERLDLCWVNETLADPPIEPPVLVDGMLRAGELCVIAAPRAVGKSWLVANLAALVGRGEGDFLGTLAVRRHTYVLVAQGELHPWQAAKRWHMLTGSDGAPGVAETFDPWTIVVERQRDTTPTESGHALVRERYVGVLDPRMRASVIENNFGLLIIDPWATYYRGDENSNDQTEAALGELRQLAIETGIALVIVHHLAKGSDTRDPEDLWRGASRLADWASTRVTLLPHYRDAKAAEEAGVITGEARRYVNVRFLRRDEPTDGFVAYLHPSGWWSHTAQPTPTQTPIRLNPEDVADACRQHGGRWPSIAAAARDLGLKRDAAARALADAVAAGTLLQEPRRDHANAYRIVDGGHLSPEKKRSDKETHR